MSFASIGSVLLWLIVLALAFPEVRSAMDDSESVFTVGAYLMLTLFALMGMFFGFYDDGDDNLAQTVRRKVRRRKRGRRY